MRKRVKDLAYRLSIPQSTLMKIAEDLDQDEKLYYHTWNMAKTNSDGSPRQKEGVTETRPINAPNKQLKHIQSRILERVLYEVTLPKYFFGGVKGKDAVKNARFHQGNKFFYQTDLKNFFPSIKHTLVRNALVKQGFYPEVAALITRLCTKSGAIPQGCPTSSFLSAMVLKDLAHDIFTDIIKSGKKLSIYVDDITISSAIGFQTEANHYLNQIRARGLKINFDKTTYSTKNPLVTGTIAKNNGISPTEKDFEKANDPNRSEESRNGYIQRINYIKRTSKKKPT